MEWWPFTQRMGIQLTSFYVVNVVPRGEEGGRAERTGLTELWRTFVREKFNSIPFINIKTSPIISCQKCSVLNFPVCDITYHGLYEDEDIKAAHWSCLHPPLYVAVFWIPWWCCSVQCVSFIPGWIFSSSLRTHKKHHFTSFLCHFRPWDGVKSYLFVENISSDYIRKENESITFVRHTHPNQKTLSPSQTHIFWQLNRGETFPFLDLVLCCKRK